MMRLWAECRSSTSPNARTRMPNERFGVMPYADAATFAERNELKTKY